jgi:hypothetical protein
MNKLNTWLIVLELLELHSLVYFGYRSLESLDHALFYVSGFIFVLAVVIGTFILAIPRSKDDGKH